MTEEEKGALVESGQAKFDKGKDVVSVETSKIIGLTKEQLEQYRNDPFWKPIRLILFALFWVAWIAMFAGAIMIVVLSPKCAAKQEPDWWQTKVSYQLLTPTFYDFNGDGVGDFAGIKDKLDLLRKIGITTVYPSPVIAIDKNEMYNAYDVVDHLNVDPRFGSEQDFKALIDAAHDRNMFVVMDMPVSCVSINHPWFQNASHVDYFIWANEGAPGYNLSVYHEHPSYKGKRYLGYKSGHESVNPVLNWKNEKVKAQIQDAVKKFLILGVDGFHIDHISQLAVDSKGEPDHDEIVKVLGDITREIKNFVAENADIQGKKIVLFSSLRDVEDMHAKAAETGILHYAVDTTFAKLDQKKCVLGVAKCVHDTLDAAYARHAVNKFTPYWQFSNADVSRLSSRFDVETANLLTFTQLTLPGALSVYYGQELGLADAGSVQGQRGIMPWTVAGENHHGFVNSEKDIGKIFFPEGAVDNKLDNFEAQYNEPNSPLKVYKRLAQLRQRDEALIIGDTVRDALVDDVILFSRFVKGDNMTMAAGNAFVVALNFGKETAILDLNKLKGKNIFPLNKDISNAEVSATTTGVTEYLARQKVNLASSKLVLAAKQGILFKL